MKTLSFTPRALAIHDQINQTVVPYPDISVKELFERCVEDNGAAAAVAYRHEVLSYREVNRLSNGLAARLRQLEVRPGDRVGVCLGRTTELIIALLGIIKCGATYLPFDADWPDETLRIILDSCRCKLILSRSADGLRERFPKCQVVELRQSGIEPVNVNPALNVESNSIAYINFTSGTTGQPKGVQIEHRSIARLVSNPRYAELNRHTVLLHMSPITFDAATFEIWGALLNGGTCVLYPSKSPYLSELKHVIEESRVNCVFITTALLNTIIDEAPDTLGSVHAILFGGEAYSDRHVRQALDLYGARRLVHVYGPTECTTFATYYPVDSMAPDSSDLPVGKPIQNTLLYVVSDGTLCEPGEVGEILLGGPGLSAGYVGPHDTSQDRFGEYDIYDARRRLYETGDYGYLSESGELIFCGRLDDQVKINGFRIELAALSRAIESHPDVRQSYVTVSGGVAGDKMLLAFVTPRDRKCDSRQIREDLRSRVPAYMVPAMVHVCDKLPLLSTGKVDRSALLAQHQASSDANSRLRDR